MKYKFILKINILFIVFLTIFSINIFTNNSYAFTEKTEIDEQLLYDSIPNTIELNIKESEYEDAPEDIKNIIYDTWKEKGIEIDTLEEYYLDITAPDLIYTFDSATVTLNRNYIDEDNEEYLDEIVWQKEISLVYKNHSDYNEVDKKHIDNISLTSPKYYLYDLSEENAFFGMDEYIYNYYKKLVSDSSVEIKIAYEGGGGEFFFETNNTNVALFKNDVLYDVRKMGAEYVFPNIEIPSSITSEEKIKEYIINSIKEIKPYIKDVKILDKLNSIHGISFDTAYSFIISYDDEIPEDISEFIPEYIVVKKPKKDIQKCSAGSIKDITYTGKSLKPKVTIKDGKTTLIEGKDYKLSYSNNISLGKATVKIIGMGNYTGTITKTFKIVPKKLTGLTNKKQTTNSITLGWTKQSGATKYEIYKYNSKKKKWEKVATTSSTSYTVKKLSKATTYQFKVRAYKTIDSKKYYGSYSSTVKLSTKTSTPKISSISSKSKKATLKWKKISGASGYEIYMATSKNGKYSKIKTITKGSTVKYTKKSLKKKKKYYFKIRTYRTVNGKKIYSSYSNIKSIKVK